MHKIVREKHQKSAMDRLRSAGYATGGVVEGEEDAKADVRRVKSAIRQHDDQQHGGKQTRLKLRRRGGAVDGVAPGADMARRARGGSVPHHKGKGNINIILHQGNPGEKQQAAQQGMQQGMRIGAALGARSAAQHMGAPQGGPMPPPRPPVAGPQGAPVAAGAPGPAMPGPMPAGGALKDGGAVKVREHQRRRRAAESAYR